MIQFIFRRQLAGFLFTCAAGTCLHFFFEYSGESPAAALFSAVNESIWEHMKLIYYPMLLYTLLAYRGQRKNVEGFWCVKLQGMLLALGLIPALYYTYTGALGVSADWFNVTIFFLTAAAVFYMETKQLQRGTGCALPGWAAILLLIVPGVLFTLWTFAPPCIPLFRDPVTGAYGFYANY